MSPVISGDFIFVADIAGNIYKFNYPANETLPKIIKINSGVVSLPKIKNGYLYFIANDGFLYKVNISVFKSAIKIMRVDSSPDSNKYLTKEISIYDNIIYICSDVGKLFYYDIKSGQSKFVDINNKTKDSPLIGTPVKIGEYIYFIDDKFNIYMGKFD
jgi:hypothetical protein